MLKNLKTKFGTHGGGICRAHFDTKANFEMVARE